MAHSAAAECPLHNTPCEVKFLLISTDGRWVFFSSCRRCHEQGIQAENHVAWEVTDEEMEDFLRHTHLRPWLNQFRVTLEDSDGS